MGPFSSEAAAKAASPPSGLSAILDFLTTGLSTLPGLALNQPAPAAVTSGSGIVNAVTGADGSACLWNLSLPLVGSFCILTKTEARAMIAGLILGAAGLLGLVGIALVVVEGFERSGAGQAAGKALETTGGILAFVPGAEPAGLALAGAGRVARSNPRQSVQQRRQRRQAADRERAVELQRQERQRSTATRPSSGSTNSATRPAASGQQQQLTEAQRRALAQRASEISTRVEPGQQ
jgi:hypothetical protein